METLRNEVNSTDPPGLFLWGAFRGGCWGCLSECHPASHMPYVNRYAGTQVRKSSSTHVHSYSRIHVRAYTQTCAHTYVRTSTHTSTTFSRSIIFWIFQNALFQTGLKSINQCIHLMCRWWAVNTTKKTRRQSINAFTWSEEDTHACEKNECC